jgi:hypothetical protein
VCGQQLCSYNITTVPEIRLVNYGEGQIFVIGLSVMCMTDLILSWHFTDTVISTLSGYVNSGAVQMLMPKFRLLFTTNSRAYSVGLAQAISLDR